MSKKFIDKDGIIGRPRLSPDSELNLEVKPFSRSLRKLVKTELAPRRIRLEFKNNKFILDVSHILGDRIIVTKSNAVNLANWILSEVSSESKPKTKLARVSKADTRVSSIKDKGE